MDPILTAPWWLAAGKRALRTAVVIAIPYLPAAYVGTASYWTLLSAAVLGAILSLLTALAGIKETTGVAVPFGFAIFDRVVRTVAQALVTAVGNVVLFTDVDWKAIPALVLSAAVGSLLLGVLAALPEADHPVAAAGTPVLGTTADGSAKVQSVPVTESIAEAPADSAVLLPYSVRRPPRKRTTKKEN